MNIALLRTLQARPDHYFWPESLARSLHITPARLLRQLREFEEFGFGIDHQPHRGVRFATPSTALCVEQIEWELNTTIIGRRFHVWRRTASTNDLAARAAISRSNDGLVVLAEEQTAGRGRRNRRWFAPPFSSILMSVLLFPPDAVRNAMLLTSLAALAVSELLREQFALVARIKWPNDVRVSGKKVCGILVERPILRPRGSAQPFLKASGDLPPRGSTRAASRATVIGIGVNVNVPATAFPAQLHSPASSLMELCGRSIDRSELVRLLVQRLDSLYGLVLAGKSAAVWRRWHGLADLVGQPVKITCSRGSHRGELVAICPPEVIAVRLASGKTLELSAEQVLSIAEVEPNRPARI